TFANTLANIGINNSGLLYNEGYYTVTSYLGTISDLSDQPYLSSLLNSYNGFGFRKTYGANTGDVHDKFLCVNGSSSLGLPFFQQSGIALTGGTSYSFSFFGKQANSYGQVVGIGGINDAPVLAQITNNAGSVVASSTISLTAPTAYTQDRPESAWQFGSVSFVAPATGGPFTVSLSATSSAIAGNDFYIDNITLTPCAAVMLLPITVQTFTAAPDMSGNAQLQWKIENPEQGETIIQYSNDGLHFELLANIPLQAGMEAYHFLHHNPGRPYNYYRLMIVTGSGRVIYSDVQKVSFAAISKSITLYPNPANSILYIAGTGNISHILVTNAAGKTIMTQNCIDQTLSVNTAAWKPGCYFIKISGNNGVSVHKVMIAR
ncbi:MAG TPA: T9SS type A sorting domain-containing protein, partial [Chitinophagaceae bacterium]|nr:T9SS type A sorting domain-containing protein [Chitinophagaceae bacterium]